MGDSEVPATQITQRTEPAEPTRDARKAETKIEARPGGQIPSNVRYALEMLAIIIAVLIGLQVYTWVALLRLTSSNQRREAESAAAQTALRNDVERQKAALNGALQYLTVLNQAYRDAALRSEQATDEGNVPPTHQQLKPITATEKPATGQQSIRITEAGSLPGTEIRPLPAQTPLPREVRTIGESVLAATHGPELSNKERAATTGNPSTESSESVTPLAHDHNEIERLRKLGQRDYFEFTLARDSGRQEAAPGVSLELKNTDPKRSRCALNIYADYYELPQQMSINEARFFPIHDGWQSVPIELVINPDFSRNV